MCIYKDGYMPEGWIKLDTLGTDHLIFHGGGGAFLRVLDFFLDLTDSARLFFIESCTCTIFFLIFNIALIQYLHSVF